MSKNRINVIVGVALLLNLAIAVSSVRTPQTSAGAALTGTGAMPAALTVQRKPVKLAGAG